MKQCIYLIFSIILISSCFTFPDKDSQVIRPEDRITPGSFYSDGYEILSSGNTAGFLHHLNNYAIRFPKQTQELITVYFEKQKSMFSNTLKKEDYRQSMFYLNNLKALIHYAKDEIPDLGVQLSEATSAINDGLKEVTGFSRHLSEASPLTKKEEFSPLLPVTKYNRLLAKVSMDRTYTLESGLVRKDHPRVFGSGILVDSTHILTAYHVIEHAFYKTTTEYNIIIEVMGKKLEKAKIKAWDSLTDIALLELPEPVDMPHDFYKLLGDSAGLIQGQDIYCLGHHSGLASTLTKGIISSPERKAPEMGSWIQVDANVTPGASGGMLIGEDGLLYGVLVAGIQFEEINFAIPSNILLATLDVLLDGNNIKRGWLGLLLDEKKEVVFINDIFPSSPFETNGAISDLQIISINGTPINSIHEAQQLIFNLKAGNILSIITKEADREINRLVMLKRRPDFAIFNATYGKNELSSLYPHFGFEVSPRQIKEFTIKLKGTSVDLNFYRVLKVQPDSFLASMGVKVNDYIGFIADYFVNRNRYIELLHFPDNIDHLSEVNPEDYIYYMKKGKYDENIL